MCIGILLMASCAESPKEAICKHIGDKKMIRTKHYKCFSLPSGINLKSIKLSTLIDNDKEYLYYLDNKNHLLIYNLNNRELVNRIDIAKRGPNGFGEVKGFYPIKKDSILITPTYKYGLGIINAKGEKTATLSYDKYKEYSRTRDNNDTHIYQHENKLYLPMFLEGNWTMLSEDDLSKYRTTLAYDLTTKQSELVGMPLPYEKKDLRAKRHFNYSSRYKDGFLFAFASTHDIFYTKNFKVFKKYTCKSKNVDRLAKYKFTGDFKTDLFNGLKHCEYSKILWDPYRKYLYRFYKLSKTNVKRSDNLLQVSREAIPFGIMVLDENMNIIADQKIEGALYNWKDSFVCKEGLYISLDQSNNVNADLENLYFELFEVK